jgi:fibronectin-binding autotransporter adhesin
VLQKFAHARRWRTDSRLTVAAAAAVAALVPALARADPPSGSANNRLVFADEFNGTSLDTSKWSAASPSWTMPNSLSTATASDVSVGNGVLTLTANRTSATAFDSGSISSYGDYNFTGGYVEARIELPSTPGSWPAFWGLYNGWPPEADIMEYPLTTNNGSSGLLANQYNTNYHYSTGTGNAAGAGVVTTGSSLAGTWHTFGMDWTSSTSVVFYLDGNEVNSYTGSSVAQMASMYMILDYAVGGWPGTPSTTQWPVGFTDQMKVDYVRVYQANPNADAPSSWTVNGGGSFTTAGNWSLGTPQYENETAVFGTVGTPTTAAVTLGAWQMMGGITFNGSSGGTTAYTIGTSANNIQLSNTTSAAVHVLSGSTVSQTVNANVELWSNTTFENDMTGGQTLNMNGQLTGAGTLTAIGAGTTVLSGSNSYAGGTFIGAGGTSAVLEVTNSAALSTGTVTFDLTGNSSAARLEVAGGVTLGNNVLLAGRNNTSVALESLSGNNALAGTISATSGGGTYLIQSDAGTLTLSGSAAGASVAGVALQASSGSRTFTLQGAGNGVVSGTVQNGGGTVSIAKAGTGTWALIGSNTYTGTTTVTGGTLALANASATSAISVSAGATLADRGTVATTGLLSSSGTLDLTQTSIGTLSAGTLSLSGATLDLLLGNGTSSDRIASTGAATLTGTNTINLSAAEGQSITPGSAYTIVTAASGLTVGNFAPGAKPASLNFTQFVLSTPTTGSLVVTATGNATPTTAYWTGAGSTATGDAGDNWGAGSAVNTSNWSTDAAGTVDPKQLPGSVTSVIFNAADAPAGSPTSATRLDAAYSVKGLTFAVGASTVTSATLNTNGYVLTVGSGGVTLGAASNASATIGGTGPVQLSGSQTWANQNNALGLIISTGITAGNGAATLTVGGTGTGGVTFSGVLADGSGGPLSTNFGQAGTTVLSAANTYTGTTTVAAGTVQITATGSIAGNVSVTGGTLRLTDSPGAIPATATVNVAAGGTLDVGSATAGTAATANLGALTGGGTVTRSIAGATSVTIGGTGLSGTFSGTIQNGSGTLSLVKAGTGTLTLSGSSSYTGGTTVDASGGAVQVTSGNGLGTGPVTIGQGGTNDNGELQLAGNISLTGVTTINLDSRYASNADGSPHVENVSGNNAIAANLTIDNAGGSTANILSTSGTLTLTGRLSSTGLSSARGFDFYGAGNGVVSGVVADGTAQPTFVQKDGTGTWTLAGSNTYTGGTTVNGGTLSITGSNAWGAGSLTVNDGTADLTANNTFTGGTVITGDATGGATNTGGRVVMASPGALGAAGSSITMSGNSTLEIDTGGGDNAYALHVGTTNTVNLVSGVATGSAGINHTLGSLAIGNSDVVNVTAAAAVTGGSPSITISAVTLSSGYGAGSTTFNPTTATVTLGTVTTSTAGNKTLVLDGTIASNAISGKVTDGSSAVAIEKSDSSSWTLSAANTYSGGTTIDDGGGTLLVTNGSGLGTGAVTIGNGGSNASGELALSGGITLAGVPSISIAGRLPSTAGGTATIENVSGNNSMSAGLTFNTAGGNAVNVLSTAGALTLTGPLTVATVTGSRGFNFYGAGNGTVTGVISNGSATTFVQTAGTGTWTLSASNTYSGGTTIAGGTLVAANTAGSATGSGTVTVATGGTLAGTGTIAGAVTVATGGTITAGTGATAANAIGTLTTTATQTWGAGAAYAAKVNGNGTAGVTANDRLVLSGLSLAANASSPFAIDVLAINAGAGVELLDGQQLVLASDAQAAASNPFAPSHFAATSAALTLNVTGLTVPPGESFALAEKSDGAGYDLVLENSDTLAGAPEPSGLLLLGATAGPLAMLGRRRRPLPPSRS